MYTKMYVKVYIFFNFNFFTVLQTIQIPFRDRSTLFNFIHKNLSVEFIDLQDAKNGFYLTFLFGKKKWIHFITQRLAQS